MSSVPSAGDLYDWEVAEVARRGDDDVRWLAGLAGTGAVLELACGTGRLAAPLVESGATVVGLDLDADMLRVAARRPGVHLVRGDMRRFAFAASFDVVALAYNGLQLLHDDGDRLACLRCAVAHLAPAGVVALEVTDFLAGVVRASVPPERLGVGTVAGRPVALRGGLEHDLERRLTRYLRRFDIGDGDAGEDTITTVDHDIVLYSFAPGEIEDLLARAGLAGTPEAVGTAGTRWVASRLGHPREPGG